MSKKEKPKSAADLPSTEGEIKEPDFVQKISATGIKTFEINSKLF